MDFVKNIIQNAKTHRKHIVLPEGHEERTLKAADIVLAENIAQLTIVGAPDEITGKARSLGLTNIGKADIR